MGECPRLQAPPGIVLAAGEEDLDELVGYIAAEANHEKDRRRQKRLDTAFAVINDALTERAGHDPKI